MDHPDAGQDMELLRPALEMILGRLEACENMIEKIVTGFSGAITTQKRRSLLGGLREKHGETLGGISGIYGELVGGDPLEAIADEIMKMKETGEEFDEDSKVSELIQALMGKFGKWIPKPQDLEVVAEPEAKPEEEEKPVVKAKVTRIEGPRI